VAWVFVSHAGADFELARGVCGWLIEAGHEVFLDQHPRHGIAVGEEWEQRLHNELRRADAMVCVVSSAYVASQWCADEITIARNRGITLLPVQAETGVTHPRLASVQHANLTRDPDAVRTSLIEALRLIDATRPGNRSPVRFARRFAQCTGIAVVAVIALNPLYTTHPSASTLAAPPTTIAPPTTAPVVSSPVSTAPAPRAASTSQPDMHPGPMAPGAPPGKPALSAGSLPPQQTNDPHRNFTSFELTGYWTINYQDTRYRGVDAGGMPPHTSQEYVLHFIRNPFCTEYWDPNYPCYQGQWLDSSGNPRSGNLDASVTISSNSLQFAGRSYGNPEGFLGPYFRDFQGQAENDTTPPVRFTGIWSDIDGNTGIFTLVRR
jgi:TIR domain